MVLPGTSPLDFAILLPANMDTREGLSNLRDIGLTDHHKKFLRPNAMPYAPLCGQNTLEYLAYSEPTVDDGDTEGTIDWQGPSSIEAPCFVLSFDEDKAAHRPNVGWFIGSGIPGGREVDSAVKGVDLLLPQGITKPTGRRHGCIYFNNGQLCICSQYVGLSVRGEEIPLLAPRVLLDYDQIEFGQYKFIFHFIVQDEDAVHRKKLEMINAMAPGFKVPPIVSATPSASYTVIEDWLFHGSAGVAGGREILAATNIKGGLVVAVKIMRQHHGGDMEEVKKCEEIREDMKRRVYNQFVMQFHAKLLHGEEVRLLLRPLALGDWNDFVEGRRWRSEPQEVKKRLFAQILLGLSALHSSGWIHRDIKAENLGVVRLGLNPHAVILDMSHAVKMQEGGCASEPRDWGTPDHAAPELESPRYTKGGTYDHRVDIYGLATAGFELFDGVSIADSSPCAGQNPWLTSSSATIMGKFVTSLCSEHLANQYQPMLGRMMAFRPQTRASIAGIVNHPFLLGVKDDIDAAIRQRRQLELQVNTERERIRVAAQRLLQGTPNDPITLE